MHTKDLGTWGESLVRTQIIENGFGLYVPLGENTRTDLIIERENGILIKVQVKTLNRSKRHPEMTPFSIRSCGPGYSYYYTEQNVDWFAIVDVPTKKIAWITWSVISLNENERKSLALRHSIPKIINHHGYNLFDDYIKFPF